MTHEAIGPFGAWEAGGSGILRRHAGFYLGLGIALMAVGTVAILASWLATLVSIIFIGALLIAGGIVQAGHAFGTRSWSGFFLHLIAAVLYVVVGLLTVARPALGAVSLTLVMAAFFIVNGLYKIFGSLFIRFRSWGWVLLNGVITLILGLLIFAEWPYSGLWVIGLFIGIDMIFAGWAFVMLATAARGWSSASATT